LALDLKTVRPLAGRCSVLLWSSMICVSYPYFDVANGINRGMALEITENPLKEIPLVLAGREG
jgi:hypothetical protein